VLKPAVTSAFELPLKRNPLRNSAAKIALNPYHAAVKAREEAKQKQSTEARAAQLKEKRGSLLARSKLYAARKKAFYKAAVAEGPVAF
jgi:hypothetical protein